MKLENSFASSVTSSAGIQSTSTFNIARTPHMFNILSSGLYSDKIAAVLREIGCNAMDAHIMFGTPERPIEVKLPTALDPSFYVKDWGPGLDDNELRVLYTTYGWSSKQQNEDVTGAFGLGSKSPFAYTLQNEDEKGGFSVESVKDGIKRIYTCYLDDSGAPAISRLYEGPADTDWAHGVKVSFPVQTRDISEFHKKAAEVYRWFKVKPNVLGLSVPLVEPQFKLSGSFFGISPEEGRQQAAVVMGGVRYPIRSERFNDLDKIETALLSAGIHMTLPMGAVMMTPSREELEYVEKTRQSVKAWLKRAAKEVAEQVRKDVFAESLPRWQWLHKVFSYYEAMPFALKHVLADMLTEAQTPQEDIEAVVKTVNNRLEGVPTWLGTKNEFRVYYYARYKPNRGDIKVRRRELFNGKMMTAASAEDCKLDCLNDVKVVLADSPLSHEKLRSALYEKAMDAAILVLPKDKAGAQAAKEAAEQLVSAQGIEGLPLILSSALEVPDDVVERRGLQRLRMKQTPKQVALAKQVHVYTAGSTQEVALNTLDTSKTYYMLARDYVSPGRRGLSNTNPKGGSSFSLTSRYSSQLDESIQSVGKLMAFMGHDVDHLVLVKSDKQAERLKFESLGIRPLLPTFFDLLKSPQNSANLRQAVLNFESGDLQHDQYFGQRYGVLGLLGQQQALKTAWWNTFSEQLRGHPLLRVVESFARRVDKSHVDPVSTELTDAVATLHYRVLGPDTRLIEELTQKMSVSQVLQENLYAHYPMMQALDCDVLRNWLSNAPEKVSNALLLGVMLYNTVELNTDKGACANEDTTEALASSELQAA